MSKLFRLSPDDLLKGLAVAIMVAVYKVFQTNGFHLYGIDWSMVLDYALTAAGAYLAKNLITDENGALGGVLGGKK